MITFTACTIIPATRAFVAEFCVMKPCMFCSNTIISYVYCRNHIQASLAAEFKATQKYLFWDIVIRTCENVSLEKIFFFNQLILINELV